MDRLFQIPLTAYSSYLLILYKTASFFFKKNEFKWHNFPLVRFFPHIHVLCLFIVFFIMTFKVCKHQPLFCFFDKSGAR